MSEAPAAAALPKVLEPLGEDLARVGERFAEILSDVSAESRDLVDQAARFTGKRLRPALTCLAARASGGTVTRDVATVAAIVELIHTATLIHDDILDGAQVRRTVATLNARFGDQAAVLVGDVIFSRAYRAAAWLDDPFASRYLSEVVGEVLEGEIFQDLVAWNPDLDEARYTRIIRGKTAALYEAALRVGAHYAGASEATSLALARYGHHLGMAFQIVDDLLDLCGDEEVVGKSLGSDLREGKTTLPLILWQRGLPPTERDAARALLERAYRDPVAAAEVCARVREGAAYEETRRAARREVDAALLELERVAPGEARSRLGSIAVYVVERRR
jgi:octaprenyl-diphosphate synthase